MDLILSNKTLQNDLCNIEMAFTELHKGTLGSSPTITTQETEQNSSNAYIYKSKKSRDEDYKIIMTYLGFFNNNNLEPS